MKKEIVLFFASLIFISAVSFTTLNSYASDYKGEEDRGSLFQVIGDLITGNYKVDGKPVKDKGWFQVAADATKDMNQQPMENTKGSK